MRETITMTSREQARTMVLIRVAGGELTVAEAALLLRLSERQVWRLRAAFERDGPAALVHANRGRSSSRRLADSTRARILELAAGRYAGINDSHLAELLAEHEEIVIGRSSLQRLLRAAGRPSTRRRRAPRHRSRRDRMPAEGLLLQLDGSRHDWLGDRGPRLTRGGAVDDATGKLVAATFRDQEDAAGYLTILRDVLRRHGVPVAVYRDRHGIFETPDEGLQTLEEQLADRRLPTQVGRAFAELAISSIAARSPQAKGRVERAWGTLQDRLVAELALAGVDDRDGANGLLVRFLPRFNARFAVPAQNPEPAWRPLPDGLRVDHVCCLKYRRRVAADGTVRAGASVFQLPGSRGGRSRAGKDIELQLRLDGRIVAWDGSRELVLGEAPLDPVQLRALGKARPALGSLPPSAATGTVPSTHPWAVVRPGSKLYRRKQEERRLSESVSS
jgi:transposase